MERDKREEAPSDDDPTASIVFVLCLQAAAHFELLRTLSSLVHLLEHCAIPQQDFALLYDTIAFLWQYKSIYNSNSSSPLTLDITAVLQPYSYTIFEREIPLRLPPEELLFENIQLEPIAAQPVECSALPQGVLPKYEAKRILDGIFSLDSNDSHHDMDHKSIINQINAFEIRVQRIVEKCVKQSGDIELIYGGAMISVGRIWDGSPDDGLNDKLAIFSLCQALHFQNDIIDDCDERQSTRRLSTVTNTMLTVMLSVLMKLVEHYDEDIQMIGLAHLYNVLSKGFVKGVDTLMLSEYIGTKLVKGVYSIVQGMNRLVAMHVIQMLLSSSRVSLAVITLTHTYISAVTR